MNWSVWILALPEQFDNRLVVVAVDRPMGPPPKIEVREEPVINLFRQAGTVSRVTLVRGVFRASAVHKVDDRQCVQILHTVIFPSPTTLMIPSTQ